MNWKEEHPIKLKNGKVIYNLVNAPLYHYTSLANFWNIIRSDHMYARHVRFSNDSEEYKIGEDIIRSLLDANEKIQPMEYYMICFCEEPDLLSQWREYAKDGVSLKFDFSYSEYYTILNNEKTFRNNMETVEFLEKDKSIYFLPESPRRRSIDFQRVYAKPVSVFYVKKGENSIFKDRYQWLQEEFLTDAELSVLKYMKMMIPYIKHEGFKEEKEARLLFEEKEYNRSLQVDYSEDVRGLKRPYIRVEFGNAEEKFKEECQICFCNIPDECKTEIKNCLKGNTLITYKVLSKKKLGNIDGEIIIGSTKIQDIIFNRIDYVIKRLNMNGGNYKIWCQGHLPIKEIMVGPSKNREEIKESILQYIGGIYWLKYVDVVISDIPYRE